MCGIIGIINKNNTKVNYSEIKKINDLISHRGPDDEGFYFGDSFAFGHRRLSILDLSSDGHQPMNYLDRYTITYNGEIYNYIEIREELLKDGYKFVSDTDTEVILASYDKWGEECVDRFNGMWAFAIYDRDNEIIFCSRDRFGIKPFYYTEVDEKFIFGSEIKQLLEFQEENSYNEEILIDFIVTGIIEHTNSTFFKNIYKLEQSHNLTYHLKENRYQINKYYSINFQENSLGLEESIENYRVELEIAIDFRLRSDVKVGTCLSGGLDSSSVSAIASKKYRENSNNKFVAIHAKSTEKSSDESYFAHIVAKSSELDLNIVEPTAQSFKDIIDEVVYTQEEPFGSPSIFMQYFVMKKAKELGCSVMLDGQGGDETLLGYEKYYPSVYIDVYKRSGFLKALKAMRHSVEARLPFIDYLTLESALNIPNEYKIKDGWTKYIIRRVIDNLLPKEVVWRKNKLGFNAPENTWLSEIESKMLKEIENSKILDKIAFKEKLLNNFKNLDNRLKWRLYNTAVWERVYSVKA